MDFLDECRDEKTESDLNERVLHPEFMVFTYGSNLRGRNGKGAALFAAQHHSAAEGVGEGQSGSAYAIPTKDKQLHTLPFETVTQAIERFKAHARRHDHQDFLLTRVGCGLAGFSDDQIAPLFEDAPENVIQPGRWIARRHDVLRVLVACPQEIDPEQVGSRLDKLLARRGQGAVVEIVVVGGAAAMESYCASRTLPLVRFWPDRRDVSRTAFSDSLEYAAWYATHTVIIHTTDNPLGFRESATRKMAAREEFPVRVLAI